MIYNVFSNYGNIKKLILIPLEKKALLEFLSKERSRLAIDFLNNIPFFGNRIKVTNFFFMPI